MTTPVDKVGKKLELEESFIALSQAFAEHPHLLLVPNTYKQLFDQTDISKQAKLLKREQQANASARDEISDSQEIDSLKVAIAAEITKRDQYIALPNSVRNKYLGAFEEFTQKPVPMSVLKKLLELEEVLTEIAVVTKDIHQGLSHIKNPADDIGYSFHQFKSDIERNPDPLAQAKAVLELQTLKQDYLAKGKSSFEKSKLFKKIKETLEPGGAINYSTAEKIEQVKKLMQGHAEGWSRYT